MDYKVYKKNLWMKNKANKFREELLANETNAEKRFEAYCNWYGISFKKQEIIYKYINNEIVKFWIVDFYDSINKIVFEIDGKHHYQDIEQICKDFDKDCNLTQGNFTVYRIKNKDVTKRKVYELLKSIGYI